MNPHSNLDALIGLAVLLLALGALFGRTAVADWRARRRRRTLERRLRIYDVQRERAGYDAIAANEAYQRTKASEARLRFH